MDSQYIDADRTFLGQCVAGAACVPVRCLYGPTVEGRKGRKILSCMLVSSHTATKCFSLKIWHCQNQNYTFIIDTYQIHVNICLKVLMLGNCNRQYSRAGTHSERCSYHQ